MLKKIVTIHLFAIILISIIATLLIQTIGSLGVFLSVVAIAILSTVMVSRIGSLAGEQEKSPANSTTDHQKLISHIDMYDIAGRLSFISQQLA